MRYLVVKKWVLVLGVVVYLVVVTVVVILLLVFYGHKSGSSGKDCKCPNGTPTATCANSNDPSCDTCDEGYHKDEYNACEPNQCTCTHGPHAIGPPHCLEDNAIFCTSCEVGYWLNDTNDCQACCKCDNGSPTTTCKDSKSCTQYIQNCDTCNQGYHQVTNDNDGSISCELNKCKCTNGTPVTGTDCIKDDGNICSKCNDGYEKENDNTCKPICDVEHGETWTDWPSKPGDPYGCALCPHHYYVSTTRVLPETPPTLDEVAKNPSEYQYMCSSYDKMFSSYGASFKILTSAVHANNAENVTGKNNEDANGWNGNYCSKGMCYGKTKAGWEYCLYPCYSQPKPNS